MSDLKFIPPQQNQLLTRLIQSIFYLVAYFVYKIRLTIDESDVGKMRAIADQRVVYLPNHSNLDDALVIFLLSARLGQLFHYVVALEAFQGGIGKLMQKVGAYSIRRGIGDRPSIMQTLKILQQPQCKLVIFPEGGCSYQNDTVMTFRPGAVELSFKAIEKLIKIENAIPDFYLVPVSIKYCYPGATDIQMDQALSRLETALSLESKQNNFYSRLRNIAAQILTNLEFEYQIIPHNSTDWDQRIKHLKQRMLNYCEEKLNITPLEQLRDRERIYKVQAMLRSATDTKQQPAINHEHLYLTTVRLLNFDAIYDGYVAENPTVERFFDTIDRFEREVFQIDRPKFKGQRQVIVKIGTPINLKESWPTYQQNLPLTFSQNKSCPHQLSSRQQLINNLTKSAQQLVQNNLN